MRKSELNFVPRLASASIVPLGQAGITCGSADTTAGMAMPTAGRRDGGNSRHGPVRDGSLPDTRTVVTGMCIRKATGDSSCNCCRLCHPTALLIAWSHCATTRMLSSQHQFGIRAVRAEAARRCRSEEHTSELQSLTNLV